MKYRYLFYFFSTCLAFLSMSSYAQSGYEGANAWADVNGKVTAPSPNAASLGAYGQTPVNLSSGFVII